MDAPPAPFAPATSSCTLHSVDSRVRAYLETYRRLLVLSSNAQIEFFSILLARYHPNNPPMVVFSSSWHEGDKARALEIGAREYVTKPMDLDAYAGVLRGMVER